MGMADAAGTPNVPRMMRSRCVVNPPTAAGDGMLPPTAVTPVPLGHAGAPVPVGHESGAEEMPGVVNGVEIDVRYGLPPSCSGVESRSVGEMARRTLSRSLAAMSTQPDWIEGLGMTFALSGM